MTNGMKMELWLLVMSRETMNNIYFLHCLHHGGMMQPPMHAPDQPILAGHGVMDLSMHGICTGMYVPVIMISAGSDTYMCLSHHAIAVSCCCHACFNADKL